MHACVCVCVTAYVCFILFFDYQDIEVKLRIFDESTCIKIEAMENGTKDAEISVPISSSGSKTGQTFSSQKSLPPKKFKVKAKKYIHSLETVDRKQSMSQPPLKRKIVHVLTIEQKIIFRLQTVIQSHRR